MRLVIGTQNYNYLVRLGFPLPPVIAIDDYISKIEDEIEDGINLTVQGEYFCLLDPQTLQIKMTPFSIDLPFYVTFTLLLY